MLREVLPQPRLLRRSRTASAQIFCIAIGVQCHDMPGTKVVAVITLARRPCLRSPILKISGSRRIGILMIPQGRPCAGLKFSPGRPITILKFGCAASLVRKIPRGKDGARNLFDQLGRSPSSIWLLAACDVARSDKNECLPVSRSLRRRRIYSMLDRRWLG